MRRAAAIACCALFAGPEGAGALSLDFPATAAPMAEERAPLDSHFIATGGYADGRPLDGITAEGALVQQSWRIGAGGLTTMQILAPLRAQLERAGYEVLFECETRDCGGFDFRYRLDVLPEPDMHVNLGDFRYLAARRDTGSGAPDDYASLLISRSANAGFVQLTRIGAPEDEPVIASSKAPPLSRPSDAIGARLEAQGYATLDDLSFETGSARLGGAEFASLDELARYLEERPNARIMLVGHTDTEGALDTNVALSRRRAQAVAANLVERHGIDAGRIAAEGVGYMAPRASNRTEDGRQLNRRVEVILTAPG